MIKDKSSGVENGLSPSLRKCMRDRGHSSATSRVKTLHPSVNMAGSVEARFDAAVNVVRSMPKKGINQSFHTNLFKKERLSVFLSVVFFLTCVFSVEIVRCLSTFLRHDVKGKVRLESFSYHRNILSVNLQG